MERFNNINREPIYWAVIFFLLTFKIDVNFKFTPFYQRDQIVSLTDLDTIPMPEEKTIVVHRPNLTNITATVASPPLVKKKRNFIPTPYKYTENKRKFFEYWAKTIQLETKSFYEKEDIYIPVSIKLAILALETGYGEFYSDPYNMFNIKYMSYNEAVNKRTIPEYVYEEAVVGKVANKRVTKESNMFFKFSTPWLASRYHSYFIMAPHYMKHYNTDYAKSLNAHNRWAHTLQRGRYAGSDKSYGRKLIRVINHWNLIQYDIHDEIN